jgi:DNA-binding HxlR family transcriptional regulator
MFIREKTMRALVLKHLKNSDRSISSLARELKKDGCEVHRLVLTGYLRALSEMGVLKEKEIPPSKVYSYASMRDDDVYESLGHRLRAQEPRKNRRARLGVFLLQTMFRRPIFYEELKRCSLSPPKRYRSPIAEERSEARKLLENAGVNVPPSDPAYNVSEDFSRELFEMLADEFVERAGLRSLRMETKQVKLL